MYGASNINTSNPMNLLGKCILPMFAPCFTVFLKITSDSTVSSYCWVSSFQLCSMSLSVTVSFIGIAITSLSTQAVFVYAIADTLDVAFTLLNWYSLNVSFIFMFVILITLLWESV